MAATTTDRKTLRCDGMLPVPVYQSTKIPGSVLVQDNGSGYAINAVESATYIVLGVSDVQADNSLGSSGDIYVKCEFQRAFWLANDTGSPVLISHRGGFCFVKNNQTVRASGGSYDNPVGIVLDVDSTKGVLVYIPQALLAAATVVTDLAVGRDIAVTRNGTVGGTLLVTGVATFAAKSVHSLGITITEGGETITLGNLTLTAGDLLMTKGKAVLTEGNLTLTLGNILATAGNITSTKGNIVATEGDVIITKGALTMSDGDLTMTQGLFKMVGVTANDGVQVGYNHANTAAPPVISEATTAFGAPAAGRNGFLGVLQDDGGVAYLIANSNGVFYQVALTACGA
jgi:hypothetical protein